MPVKTCDQQRFTMSEVTADWQELMNGTAALYAFILLSVLTAMGPAMQLASMSLP